MNHASHPITLATKVTILRILGIPVFILLLIYFEESLKEGAPEPTFRFLALVMFLAVALTDALDGYLARSRNEVTRLGKILDPIADKTLVLSALVMLTRPSLVGFQPQFPIWFAVFYISRDVVLFGGALLIHALSGHVDIEPRRSGKIATALLMLSILWSLAGGPAEPFLWLVAVTTAFSAFATLHYIMDGMRQFDHTAQPTPESHEHTPDP